MLSLSSLTRIIIIKSSFSFHNTPSLGQVCVGQAPRVVVGEVPPLHEAGLVTLLQTQVHTALGEAQAEVSVRPAEEMVLESCLKGYFTTNHE